MGSAVSGYLVVLCVSDCTEDQYQCSMGMCIMGWHRCDGEQHCPDGTDELLCGKLFNFEPQFKKLHFKAAYFACKMCPRG